MFSIKFVWQDLWIGAYWDHRCRRLYVCLLPCLPIVIHFTRTIIVGGVPTRVRVEGEDSWYIVDEQRDDVWDYEFIDEQVRALWR